MQELMERELPRLEVARKLLPKHMTDPDPALYVQGKPLFLDFETSTFRNGLALYPENKLVLAYWEFEGQMYRKFGNEYQMQELLDAIDKCDFIVAHNAKFELQWLARCGLDLTKVVVYDTQIAEHVLGGNRLVHQLKLDKVGERRCGAGKYDLIGKMYDIGVSSEDIPRSWLASYCRRDVELCRDVFYSQMDELRFDKRLAVVYTRCLLTPALADLETIGMHLSAEQVVAMTGDKEAEYAESQREMERLTGGINVNSPKQLSEFLYDTLGFDELTDRQGQAIRTASDGRKTDQDTIVKLKARTAVQREFIDAYRRNKALYNELTKYLRKFKDCCEENEGWLRGSFHQTTTQTHRLSSSGLEYKTQFQNFPRVYKPVFTARREGWKVGEGDGAQLEFRVAAHLGRCEVARNDIINGTDIHSVTAGIIGCTRQDAKAHTFKPLYGGQSGTPEQVKYYDFFRKKYTGIAEKQQEWINTVLFDKELVTESGLTFFWPDTRMSRSGYVNNTTSICNYPVQSLATAEIVPIALAYAWHYVKAMELEMLIVNTVHDSIIAEMPDHEIPIFHALMKVVFIDEVEQYLDNIYDIKFTVPLAAGVSVGETWGDKTAEEFTYTSDSYFKEVA